MPTKKCSRQSDWRRRMKDDPNGPQVTRLDGYISTSNADMLRTVQDSLNSSKRGALEFAIELALVVQTLRGKVAERRLSDLCWARAAQADRTKERKKRSQKASPVAQPEAAEGDSSGQ